MSILVTGGAGYIGSHTVLELLEQNRDVVVVDNLSNSSLESLLRVKKLTGKNVQFYQGDIRDTDLLTTIFTKHNIDAVVHFAAFKSLNESIEQPLSYYQNNVAGTLCLLEAMQKAGVFQFVFSSTAAVYGSPKYLPIDEQAEVGGISNPYGKSKLMVETILEDVAKSDERWKMVMLRYFNPVGAHESGLIGEDPDDIPNNLLPYISKVAAGQLPKLNVYGSDYNTPDGTGVRDFIHVVDLAKGHVKALDYMSALKGAEVFNLGTGQGYSVLEMVNAFEKASKHPVPYVLAPRRKGDEGSVYADPSKAKTLLGWQAERGLNEMMTDSWRWQSQNPHGYKQPK